MGKSKHNTTDGERRKPLMPVGHVMTTKVDKANTRQSLKKQLKDEVALLDYNAEQEAIADFWEEELSWMKGDPMYEEDIWK